MTKSIREEAHQGELEGVLGGPTDTGTQVVREGPWRMQL